MSECGACERAKGKQGKQLLHRKRERGERRPNEIGRSKQRPRRVLDQRRRRCKRRANQRKGGM